MAAKLGTVSEYVYLWNKLLYPVVFDSLREPVGLGPLVVLTVRSSYLVGNSSSTIL